MLNSVATTTKAVKHYRSIIGDERINELQRLAGPLKGARILHLNSTAFGGGVAEILAALVPLMQDLGLHADWQVIKGAGEFSEVTKAMHNGLQGGVVQWTEEMRDIWLRYNQMNAEIFDENYDFVVVHDPQPAGILAMILQRNGTRHGAKWIWRCHIDLTEVQPDVWDFLQPFVEVYDGAIFTLEDFVPQNLQNPKVFIVPPAIDPLSPKNLDLSQDTVRAILTRYNVDPERAIISQVSRFDRWKDPLGVIDAYRLVKREIPEVQLVMAASMAADDPEGWFYYERTLRKAGEDFDIHFFTNFSGVGDIEVNAFQRASAVVLQKSIREGFGLVVAEALWKERPVVAGGVGGIPMQIHYGRTGYLVTTLPECVDRLLYLLRRPKLSERMGRAGREHIREHFLITRYLRDYLRIFHKLAMAENAKATTGEP